METLKEKLGYIVAGTLIPMLIKNIIGKGNQIEQIKNELTNINNEIKNELQIVAERDKNRDLAIDEIFIKIQKLEESRNSLSDYYVTRAEFNRVIENQQKTIDKIDKNIEKLMEKVIYK